MAYSKHSHNLDPNIHVLITQNSSVFQTSFLVTKHLGPSHFIPVLPLTKSRSYIREYQLLCHCIGQHASNIGAFPFLYFSKALCSHLYENNDSMILQTILCIFLSTLSFLGSIFESPGLTHSYCSLKACTKCT